MKLGAVPLLLPVGLRMSDPRLNSVHLPGPRRAVFRQARAALAAACGDQTLYGQIAGDESSVSRTIIRQESAPNSVRLDYWLADGEYIYPLKLGLNTVGRSPENDVVVTDAFVSRRQCAIVLHHHRGCELFDIASKNGTVLNGQKLSG